MYRQGDVLITPVDELPKSAKIRKRTPGEGIILASGEATGHHHRVKESTARLFATSDGRRFLRVARKGAVLTHEEHDPISFDPGLYEVKRQREYVAPKPKQPPIQRYVFD